MPEQVTIAFVFAIIRIWFNGLPAVALGKSLRNKFALIRLARLPSAPVLKPFRLLSNILNTQTRKVLVLGGFSQRSKKIPSVFPIQQNVEHDGAWSHHTELLPGFVYTGRRNELEFRILEPFLIDQHRLRAVFDGQHWDCARDCSPTTGRVFWRLLGGGERKNHGERRSFAWLALQLQIAAQ